MDVSKRSFIMKPSWTKVVKWITTVCRYLDFFKKRDVEQLRKKLPPDVGQ